MKKILLTILLGAGFAALVPNNAQAQGGPPPFGPGPGGPGRGDYYDPGYDHRPPPPPFHPGRYDCDDRFRPPHHPPPRPPFPFPFPFFPER